MPPEYLRFDTKTNIVDSFKKARVSLETGELKWFIIAFHHGIQHLLLIFLYRKNPFLIWESRSRKKAVAIIGNGVPNPFDINNKLINPGESFKRCCKFFPKNTQITKDFTLRMMKGLFLRFNNKLRNPFAHFPPVGWSLGHGHIREICSPLTHLAKFLIKNITDLDIEPEIKEAILNDLEKSTLILDSLE